MCPLDSGSIAHSRGIFCLQKASPIQASLFLAKRDFDQLSTSIYRSQGSQTDSAATASLRDHYWLYLN
jgi:hypothetical protein